MNGSKNNSLRVLHLMSWGLLPIEVVERIFSYVLAEELRFHYGEIHQHHDFRRHTI